MGAGGNVEKHHFIGALFVVSERQFNRVADGPEFSRFGPTELDPAGDLSGVDVQAGDDAFGNHKPIEPVTGGGGNKGQKQNKMCSRPGAKSP
jgi:hypothetical protein